MYIYTSIYMYIKLNSQSIEYIPTGIEISVRVDSSELPHTWMNRV